MTKECLISVIMPVYNAREYLERAVSGVLSQTYKNLELILVDDCSPDKSGILCDELAAVDSRIRVVHMEQNGGPGMARNKALALARGKYISFVDSDDLIDPDMLEALYQKAIKQDCDLVICGYFQNFLNKNGQIKYTVEVIPPDVTSTDSKSAAAVMPILDEAKVFSFLWNKLFKAAPIRDNKLTFSSLAHSEDFFFIVDLLNHISRICTVAKPYYHYFKPVRETLTSAYVDDFALLMSRRFFASRELVKNAGIYEGNCRIVLSNIHIKHLFAVLERNCWKGSGMTLKARRQAIKDMLKDPDTKEVIKYACSNSRASRIMNGVLKTKSIFLISLFARLVWFTKRHFSRIFDRVK